ncbi:helix-turn-helix domain-containing protein [Fusibacter ferrireducens]|uniref:Helix-turn-helix domain-containing protein n=1 Tax=Fusibacter ferrireducens TaxID=2785058 RepID=A0ABR9ZP80_9FIRM|nr:helix-turn-helix domain-containing protein [Fusibacter ferrireducens]MBF4692267.1 helix-turn-helix domain-containing protein [Fusibacter ferrireducens]
MTNKGKLIESVYKADLSQRATLVIFYLINRADIENTCFPSVRTIAKECNISTRTVQRALTDLEEAGFLTRESRFHEQGGQRSNLYHLIVVDNDIERMESIESEMRFDEAAKEKSYSGNGIMGNIDKISTLTDYGNENKEVDCNNFEQVSFESFSSAIKHGSLLTGTPCQEVMP